MKVLEFLKNQKVKRVGIGFIIAFIILLLELFVFNYRAYSPQGSNFTVSTSNVQVSYAALVDDESASKPTYRITSNTYPSFKISFDEEKDIRTVAPLIDFTSEDIYRYEMSVTGYYVDNGKNITIEPYRTIEYIRGLEISRYYQTEFNHPVSQLEITFKAIDHTDSIYNQQFTFEGFELNYKVPFHFSAFRFLGLNFLALGTYGIVLLFINRKKEATDQPKKPLKQRILDFVIYALPIIGVTIIYALYANFMREFSSANSGTQLSKELVDAFLKGHVYLDAVPSDELLALPNPYDRAARNGVSYLWDHLLYNGKYYSYYGITPVFMLFLPFKVIFNRYLADAYVVLLFTIIGLVFMALSFETLVNQISLKRKIPLYLKYTLYLILAIGSGACFQVVRPYFYEVATSCAFMCAMIALFHFLKSGVLYPNPEKKYFYYHLVFSSLWVSLAVLARATFALYAIAHLIYLGYYFIKNRKEMVKKQIVLFFVLALAPYAVFGSIQCAYNYMRFGSIFDFGIQYSLTIADFMHMPFHFGNVLTSIFHFFFNPGVTMEYPFFMKGNTLTFGAAYYYYETGATIGLFARIPLLFSIFVLPFFIASTKKERLLRLLLGWFPCVIIPLIQVILTWQSGYATRYYTDFSWPILLFMIVLWLKFYDERVQSEHGELGVLVIMCASVLLGFIYTSGTILVYIPCITHYYGNAQPAFTNFYYRLGRLLSFWR